MQTNFQIYVKGSVEAVSFYQKAFGWTIGMNFKNDDGSYEHASLMFDDREMLAIAEDALGRNRMDPNQWPIMSFSCHSMGSREAVDQAYQVLSKDALATDNPDGPSAVPWCDYCFSVVDKFGVYWWVAM